MDTVVKKNLIYDAAILKTSDLSTGLIYSYFQSREGETIPLSLWFTFLTNQFKFKNLIFNITHAALDMLGSSRYTAVTKNLSLNEKEILIDNFSQKLSQK